MIIINLTQIPVVISQVQISREFQQKQNMYKAILLTFLLLTALAQDQVLESSVTKDGSQDAKSIRDLPSIPKSSLPPTDFAARKSTVQALKSSTWITQPIPTPFWITTFTINYQTFCPNTVYLWITASGYFRVYQNGVLVQNWSAPFPNVIKIALTPQCQCNKIVVQVYNLWTGSAGILYNIVQNTVNCYNCKLSNFYWNYPTCRCECKLNCCPPGKWLDKANCICRSGFIPVDVLPIESAKGIAN